jgi:transcription initiation factor TFIIIB Brf1 subunit/transcription initiation factor TFIIB
MDDNIWTLCENLGNELIGNNRKETVINDKCENCDSDDFINEDGMIVCQNCGTMKNILIDYKQEWRFYGADDTKGDPTRCGNIINQLFPESSLGTVIYGNGYEKLKQLNNWNIMTYKERILLRIFKQLQEKADIGLLPLCVIDRAKVMYKLICNDNIKRGKSRNGLIGACIYYSCKDKNLPLSMYEISKIFNLKLKNITYGCKQFNELMLVNNIDYSKKSEPIKEFNYIDKFCNKLGINSHYKEKILYTSDISIRLGITIELTPQTIAIGSIILISDKYNLNIDKNKLLDISGLSRTTMDKVYKKLLRYSKFLL